MIYVQTGRLSATTLSGLLLNYVDGRGGAFIAVPGIVLMVAAEDIIQSSDNVTQWCCKVKRL